MWDETINLTFLKNHRYMTSTITMPTPIFILFIVLILWIVWRDDIPHKPKFKSYQKRFIVHDDCEFLNAQMELEKRQEDIFELN